ncbi:MAG TPA: hypothetical protein VK108_01060 [Pseudogracilibacillus sp.]|nr:hypothetical protein [Pseudogracilibacillus sp.]
MDEKRIGDQREKFLVARMTERQKKIAQYKAHKTNQSVDELVIEAVAQLDEKSFWNDHHCPSCGEEKHQEETSYVYHHEGEEIKVRPYYKMVCGCEDNKNDFFAENYLEDLVAFEVQQLEREGKEIPSELYLDQLLTMEG